LRELSPHALQLDRRGRARSRSGRRAESGCGACVAGRSHRGRAQAGSREARDSGQEAGGGSEAESYGKAHDSSQEVSPVAVTVDRLEKTLGKNHVLRGISFEAHAGEIFGLLGPNGAGKTTTLRIICTLLAPDAGSVEVLGFDTRTAQQEVRGRVGVVTAEIGVYPRLTARENITYFAELSGVFGEDLDRKVRGVIERLDMSSFADQRAESLSSGQKQKVAIARAVVHDPPVLMFDEPTSNLDVLASREIREFMVESKHRGKCVIFSTHVLHDAERLCDRVTIIHHGLVVASGSTGEVRGAYSDLEDSFLALVEAPA
jgi:sodium transport system ATP-binding protein